MKKQTKWIAVLLMVCLMLTGFTGCAVKTVSVGDEKTQENVTVSATGTVQLIPDMASVTFSVMTKEATAQQAQEKNSETVQNVTETLVQKGVEEKSIRTSNYSMYPQYDYGEGERILTGYIVSTTITVQDQLIENVGQLLSDCVAAGVNSIDSVVFLCSGYDEAYAQALGLAVEEAKAKAEALAKAAGKTLDGTVRITEGWQDTSARYANESNQYAIATEEAMDSAKAISFLPGETKITANVTVTYGMH